MAASPSSSVVGLLQLAGRIACLIVIAWFAVFAVEQTSNASAHQQSELNGGPPATSSTSSTTSAAGASPASSSGSPSSPGSSQGATSSNHESTPHKVLNETATALTAPFAAVVAGSHSEWVLHIVKTLLALLVYGVAIGYLVRIVRVRV
jgi:cytoskeletal protein RodZ